MSCIVSRDLTHCSQHNVQLQDRPIVLEWSKFTRKFRIFCAFWRIASDNISVTLTQSCEHFVSTGTSRSQNAHKLFCERVFLQYVTTTLHLRHTMADSSARLPLHGHKATLLHPESLLQPTYLSPAHSNLTSVPTAHTDPLPSVIFSRSIFHTYHIHHKISPLFLCTVDINHTDPASISCNCSAAWHLCSGLCLLTNICL